MTTYNKMYFDDNKGTLTAAGENAVATGLAVLIDAVTANNYEKGWRPRPEDMPMGNVTRNVGELIALLHSEVTEAFEAHRNNEPALWYEYDSPLGKTDPTGEFAQQPMIAGEILGKPQGMASELADVIIRVLDMAQEFDIPLIDAVITKHSYNQTRPYRHGNKAC
ncbi:hypothetical protein FZI85_25000 [Mycobacterium sp. CBMA293]|uniref:hypothetical protein n=1 Tax=unclassified Mycolicibacterium TaxID=2636767 RepID=UPI0012DBEBAB|nr:MULTISPECIES: hypothetical protein [unclassified Mycolicibacterium]MUL47575.1 hypothetical protein [Mycolicibacterium sp. CBMA 360]MUL61907.1 hypothetical protein [Mycolicibacterium sp. CBMA 335]MUL68980.1 hypothetical protein [Mycolicibacterium sp. CBMA 311]MUL92803.1 hypothetical protein [Mycolicibacterium sp. CBMA 230]MUM08755.1 hypothetical protein [Mycolicibacterium sp. CBMA 213]